jgi:hypothetical protein
MGVTVSNSPFTDEAWNLMNARNLVVLGRWSTDDWNRQLITPLFSAIHAVVLAAAGPGIIQARLVEIGATALTALALALGLSASLGRTAALIGAIAFSTSALVLYYGRLVYLEPLTALGLTAAVVLIAGVGFGRPWLYGALAGLGIAGAIGTKLLAVPDAGGLLAGVVAVGFANRATWRWIAAAIGTCAVALVVWALLIWLPNHDALAVVLRTLPPESLPHGVGGFVSRLHAYLFQNDDLIGLAGPLLAGGLLGGIASLALWRRLDPAARLSLGAALGWALAGLATLAVVPYSPNRYAFPVLPALAILVAVGVRAIASALPPATLWRRPLTATLAAVALIALAAPGLARYAGWMGSTSSTLPAIQERALALIPVGATVQGTYAPLFAMRVRAVTIITNFGINSGDLYAARNVRWFVDLPTTRPVWAAAHAQAWANRQQVMCASWAARQVCVYRIP